MLFVLLWFYCGRLYVSGLWSFFCALGKLHDLIFPNWFSCQQRKCIWQCCEEFFLLFLLQDHWMLFCLISVEEVTLGYNHLIYVVCVHVCFFHFRRSCQCHSQTINYHGCSHCTLSLNTAVAALTIRLYWSQSGGKIIARLGRLLRRLSLSQCTSTEDKLIYWQRLCGLL